MRSGATWQLQPDAEREILLPWLDSEPDPVVRLAVLDFIEDLLRHPYRPHFEDEATGIFTVGSVPGTTTTMSWVLDAEQRQITLVAIL